MSDVPGAASPVLAVEGLQAHLVTRAGVVKAVDGVSFSIAAGEALGLVGESGSGKSMTCLSLVGLLPRPAGRIVGGRILLNGRDLRRMSARELRRVRGAEIGMVLQDPLMSLNPVLTIGDQVGEAFRLDDRRVEKGTLRRLVVGALERVHIPGAGGRLRDYPFQFSGGMRQRTTAAIAMARNPRLLIADEPTTALDVTMQDQFLRLLKEMQSEAGMALLLVTHDLGVVAETCDHIAVMYAGRIVESGSVRRVFAAPAHPYTQALLESLPQITGERRSRLQRIEGDPPRLLDLPPGCSFAPRCPQVFDRCRVETPPEVSAPGGGTVRCWIHGGDETAPRGKTASPHGRPRR